MQISFSASGTPDQVNASLYQQSKTARASNPDHAAPAIATLRDYIAHELTGADREARVSVSATIAVTVTKTAPAPAAARGVLGVVESTVGEVPVGDGSQLGEAVSVAPSVTPASRSVVERRKKA
jgi:hypothetical protein